MTSTGRPGGVPGWFRARRIGSSVLLALASTVVSLGLVELGLRVLAPVSFLAPPDQDTRDAWRGLVHRPSEVLGLAYELVPAMARDTRHGFVETNSHGMRDAEPLPKGTPGVVRIAAVGDSFTFGFGVGGEQTFPNLLERLLQGRAGSPNRAYEVLNMGVGGYSSVDEALVVRHKALSWDPALVVVAYALNDPEIDPVQPLRAHFIAPKWWQHFHLLRLVAMASHDKWRLEKEDYLRALHDPESRGWRSVEQAFRDIGEDARARGIPVILAIIPRIPAVTWDDYGYLDVHRQVADAARAAGLDPLDLLPALSARPRPSGSLPTIFTSRCSGTLWWPRRCTAGSPATTAIGCDRCRSRARRLLDPCDPTR